MDISGLEKLSCLQIKKEDKEKIVNGLNSVWHLMEDLKSVDIDNKMNEEKLIPTIFVERKDVMFNTEDNVNGIKMQDSKFEAPRVVRKK